jgi:hypothetical protein
MIHFCVCSRWFIPFIGHMGICTSAGIIRDFAGPYFVSVSHLVMLFLVGEEAFKYTPMYIPGTWRLRSYPCVSM